MPASRGSRGETAKEAVVARRPATRKTAVKKKIATGRIVRGDSSLETCVEDMESPPVHWRAAIGFVFTTPGWNELFLAKQASFAFCQKPGTFDGPSP